MRCVAFLSCGRGSLGSGLPRAALMVSYLVLTACTSAPKPIAHAVAPQSPSKDKGQKADATTQPGPSEAHAAALEQLTVAAMGSRSDREKTISVPLPDRGSWRRVRFLGVKSLVGWRYGTEHHGVVGAFVMDVKNHTPERCHEAFEAWAKPWLEVFDVRFEIGKPVGFVWRNTIKPSEPPEVLSAVTLHASTSSLMAQESYHATYAIYPAWPDKCLVIGMATAARGEDERARKARDRFAKDVFSSVELTSETPPTKAY